MPAIGGLWTSDPLSKQDEPTVMQSPSRWLPRMKGLLSLAACPAQAVWTQSPCCPHPVAQAGPAATRHHCWRLSQREGSKRYPPNASTLLHTHNRSLLIGEKAPPNQEGHNGPGLSCAACVLPSCRSQASSPGGQCLFTDAAGPQPPWDGPSDAVGTQAAQHT